MEGDDATGGVGTGQAPPDVRMRASAAAVREQADAAMAEGAQVAADVAAEPDPAPRPAAVAEPEHDDVDLLDAAERLRDALDALDLTLEVPGSVAAREELDAVVRQMDDYLLPRLRRMDAPLLAVVGGSTGAGKSTLVNSLLRRLVSRSGVLRPTTRSPVLVHHPFDSGAFLSQRILPGLARVTSEAPEPVQPIDVDAPRITALRLVPDEHMPPGLALIDAPDIDSVVDTNRELAVQLLAAADLWLFVTTAARYADAMPWEMLHHAVERGVSVAVVLDRVPPEALQDIRIHLATMLRDRGLAGAPMFTVPETQTVDGFLPPQVVAPLWSWLTRLARDARTRALVVNRTLAGALESLPDRVASIADAADAQAATDSALRSALDASYAAASTEIASRLSDGTLLRGEVLARWQEFVGTGELFRTIETGIGRLRDRVGALVRGRPAPPSSEPLGQALQSSVEAMVRARAQAAVDDAVLHWRADPAGAALLADRPDLARLSGDFDHRLERAVRDWQGFVLDLVRTEGQNRRGTARIMSLGVNGTGVVLMLVAFAHTGGLVGAEVGIAAGTAAVAQRLLEAIFGDQAVRSLAARARKDLLRRVGALLDAEKQRVVVVLGPRAAREGRGAALRRCAAAVEEAG